MVRIRPCWSCQSDAACFRGCECRKCIAPDDYERWRQERPDQYLRWLARQAEDPDDYDRLMRDADEVRF